MSSAPRPLTVVTGGSQGIGAATAVHLAGLGHDVVVGYRSSAAEAGAVVAAAEGLGVRAIAVRADVADPADVDALFAAAAELGPVTGLVANAGLTAHLGDLADTPVEVIRQVIDVNLLGVVLCARRAAQVMSRRRGGAGGAIVTVSSGAATLGSPHEYVHYAAAKAGVDALTMGLAKELADDGVRVNAVAPGLVRTGIHAGAGTPAGSTGSWGACRWGGRGSPTRSRRRSPGCSDPRRATAPARCSGWPAGCRSSGGRCSPGRGAGVRLEGREPASRGRGVAHPARVPASGWRNSSRLPAGSSA